MTAKAPVVDVGEGRDFMGLGARVHRVVHPTTVGSEAVAVSIAICEPGERIKRHRHSYEEAYFVLTGTGTMYLEGFGDIELFPGRAIYVPPNTIHGQVNTASEGNLEILCSLSPPPPDGDQPELFE